MTDRTEQWRLFVAIDLPQQVKDALAKTIGELRAELRGPYRWVDPMGMHLTLKFLGNVELERAPSITSAVAEACSGRAGFALQLSGAGTFPEHRSPSVVWTGLGGNLESLADLQASVEESLSALGFAPEQRAFSPHLTLARVRDRLGRSESDRLHSLLAGVRYDGQRPFEVHEVSLIRSVLGPGGAQYATLSRTPLR